VNPGTILPREMWLRLLSDGLLVGLVGHRVLSEGKPCVRFKIKGLDAVGVAK
jgi:hypothetical protein